MDRKCYCCGKIKPLESFVKDNRRVDGHGYLCRECKKLKDKEYHQKIKQDPVRWAVTLEKGREFKKVHHEEVLQYNREYNRRPEVIERKSKWSRNKYKSIDKVLQIKLNAAKRRALNKNIPFDLDLDYLKEIITTHCPILEIELNWNGGPRADNTPALDRIIPSEGYIKGNVKFISTKANSIKTNASFEDLITFSKNIIKYFNKEDIVRTTENKESVELEDKEPLG